MSGEAASLADPSLPGQQRALAEAVLERASARGIPVITILFSGRPLMVSWLAAKANALLAAWFLGSEAGNAIADVVSGRVSPSGRTPISWPRALGQVPVFFGQRPSGRPADAKDRFSSRYLDLPNEPLYPFGHGLTYGRCTLGNLRATPQSAAETDIILVEVDVINEGARAADETVFLFSHDLLASVARPLLELKGIARVTLQPGESTTARISLLASDLAFLGPDLRRTFEAGEVELLVGPCADRARLLVAQIQLRA
jgi:beta-glucosidase